MYTLLFDLNNLAIRIFMGGDCKPTSSDPEYVLWKYLVFEQIYWKFVNINKEYPINEIVLAVDAEDYWRKLTFKPYKAQRLVRREKDDIDWDTFYKKYFEMIDEFKDNLPLKVLKINRAEADDIIGALCLNKPDTNFVVVSNDKDYLQLSELSNTKIYNPSKSEFVKTDAEYFLTEQILTGQAKDNIFNCKTPIDYPAGLRKPGLGPKAVEKILDSGIDKFLDTEITIKKTYTTEEGDEVKYESTFLPRDRFKINKILTDFRFIPQVLINKIIDKYENHGITSIEKLMEYLKKQNWRYFIDSYEITRNVLVKLDR